MSRQVYTAVQLALLLCYCLDVDSSMRVLYVAAMYGCFFWNLDRIAVWMQNRDSRGRFVKGNGPISG